MSKASDCDPDWYTILMNKQSYSKEKIMSAIEYVTFNFMKLIEEDQIFKLGFEEFLEIIQSDNLNVENEEMVFKAVNLWLTKNTCVSEPKKLFAAVRMALLSPKFLIDNVSPLTAVNRVDHTQFINAIRYHLLPDERESIPEDQKRRRKMFKKILAIHSLVAASTTITEMYDSTTNTWTFLKDFGLKKTHFSAGIIGNNLMIVGGQNAGIFLDTVEIIDLITGKLSIAASLKTKRHNHGVAVLGTGDSAVIYAIGGISGVGVVENTVEKWDLVTRDWTYVSPMAAKRDYLGVAVLDNKIYVIGELNKGTFHDFMEMYDPKKNKWEKKAPLNNRRNYCLMAAAGNNIFAIGGFFGGYGANPSYNVERYNPIDDSWTNIASISSSGNIGVGPFGYKMIRAGGQPPDKSVEEYNPDTKEWKRLAPLSRDAGGLLLLEIPWKLFDHKFEW